MLGCGSVCVNGFNSVIRAKPSIPPTAALSSGRRGTYLGNKVFQNGVYEPPGYQSAASSGDGTAIFQLGRRPARRLEHLCSKALGRSRGRRRRGGGGGGGSTNLSRPFLAVVSSNTIIAQWTNVPGNNYVAVLATDSGFTSICVSSVTIVNTFRSTFTALMPLTTYYFEGEDLDPSPMPLTTRRSPP